MADPSTPTLPQIGEETARELLACPFCGSTEVSVSFSVKLDNPDPSARFIECEDCGAMGPPCDIADHGSDDAAKLAAAACWSSRAALGPPPTDVREGVAITDELRPCPFCAGRAHMLAKMDDTFEVECGDCTAIAQEGDSYEEAARQWNNRPLATPLNPSPSCLGVVEALEKYADPNNWSVDGTFLVPNAANSGPMGGGEC